MKINMNFPPPPFLLLLPPPPPPLHTRTRRYGNKLIVATLLKDASPLLNTLRLRLPAPLRTSSFKPSPSLTPAFPMDIFLFLLRPLSLQSKSPKFTKRLIILPKPEFTLTSPQLSPPSALTTNIPLTKA